jgi:ribonuclease P protein component
MATLPAPRVPGSLMALGLQRASPPDSGSRTHEAHLSTEPDSAPSRPWLPLADEDPRWPARAQAPPRQRAEAAHSVDSVETRVILATGPFPREARIRRSREFREITKVGRRHSSGAFVLLVRADSGNGRTRLGITASRRVGNAVVRNRVKRRIREWFRRGGRAQLRGHDVVVIARASAARLGGLATCDELSRVAQGVR